MVIKAVNTISSDGFFKKLESIYWYICSKLAEVRMRVIFFLCFFHLMVVPIFSQDMIHLNSGDSIRAKVTEITSDFIGYKRFSNLDGPVYQLKKSEVAKIIYKNGETDNFNLPQPKSVLAPAGGNTSEERLKELTGRGRKVWVISDNSGAIIHANNKIRMWGYWTVANDQNSADFILRINIRYIVIGDAIVSGQIIDVKTNEVIKVTREVNSLGAIQHVS